MASFHTALKPGIRVRTQGLQGAVRGYVLARLVVETQAPLLCIAADEDAAEQLMADVAFFLGGRGTLAAPSVLQLPGDEVLPWDEVSPDVTVISERLRALFHLRQGTPFRAPRSLLASIASPSTAARSDEFSVRIHRRWAGD